MGEDGVAEEETGGGQREQEQYGSVEMKFRRRTRGDGGAGED